MRGRNTIRPTLSLAVFVACLLFSASGCGPLSTAPQPTVSPSPSVVPTTPPHVEQATPTPFPHQIRLWLPPDLDPSNSTFGPLIDQTRDQLLTQYPDLQLDIRIKSSSDLVQTLSLTGQVAPTVLPDLTVLSRYDMESAVSDGLLFSFDSLTDLQDDKAYWFPYALASARVRNTTYSIPFSADALVLVYRYSPGQPAPTSWADLAARQATLTFPAADPQALFPLSLYRSMGGTFFDTDGRPTLDQATLQKTLSFFASLHQKGLVLDATAQFQTDQQAWQAYTDGRANVVVTWSSNYFRQGGETRDRILLVSDFASGLSPEAMTNTWGWVLSSPDPARQKLAAAFVEAFIKTARPSQFDIPLGQLPPFQASLSAYSDPTLAANAKSISTAAQPMVPAVVQDMIGPIMRDAVVGVLTGQSSQDATAAAMLKLK